MRVYWHGGIWVRPWGSWGYLLSLQQTACLVGFTHEMQLVLHIIILQISGMPLWAHRHHHHHLPPHQHWDWWCYIGRLYWLDLVISFALYFSPIYHPTTAFREAETCCQRWWPSGCCGTGWLMTSKERIRHIIVRKHIAWMKSCVLRQDINTAVIRGLLRTVRIRIIKNHH